GRVVGGGTAEQFVRSGTRDAELTRVDRFLTDRPVRHHPRRGRGRCRDLVESVVTSHLERGLTPACEHLGEGRGFFPVGTSDHAGARLCRVGQRAEQIERGRHAEFGTRGTREAQRGVEPGSQAEADANLVEAAPYVVRREFESDPEGLEYVGSACFGGHGAVTVLDNRYTSACGDQGGHRGDIHRPGAVTAGTDNVD